MAECLNIPLGGLSVMIGMPSDRSIPYQTVESLLGTFSKCSKVEIHAELGMIAGCAIVTKARDDVVNHFLESDCNYLFWIDSDMEWDAGQFLRILALSTQFGVVGATYPAKIDKEATYFVKMKDLEHPVYNDIGLMDVEGMGLGFTCMPREIVEEVAATKPLVLDKDDNPFAAVFRVDTHEGHFRGEDMAFFADICELGHKVWLDPLVDLGHVGPKTFRGDFVAAWNVDTEKELETA